MAGFSYNQRKALSIIPHISGPFSMVGSMYILYDILRDKNKWTHPYYRLLFSMCIFDVFSSIALGLSTWPIPPVTMTLLEEDKEVVTVVDEGASAYEASGTTATCAAQAFFIQANIASPILNYLLSVYFLLVVKYSMTTNQIRHRIEPCMQAFTATFALGTACACWGMGMLNDASLWCWINALPKGCDQSYKNDHGDDEDLDNACTRGDNAEIFRWSFFFAPLWAAILGSMVAMGMLYATVRQQEIKASQWKFQHEAAAAQGQPPQPTFTSIMSAHHDDEEEGDEEEEALDEVSNHNHHQQLGAQEQLPQVQPPTAQQSPPTTSDTKGSDHNIDRRAIMLWKLQQRKQSCREYRKSRMVAAQALRYVAVFYLTWVAGTTNRLLQLLQGHSYFWIMALHAFFTPLQGFFNFLVYTYPKFRDWKRQRRKEQQRKQRQELQACGNPHRHPNGGSSSYLGHNYSSTTIWSMRNVLQSEESIHGNLQRDDGDYSISQPNEHERDEDVETPVNEHGILKKENAHYNTGNSNHDRSRGHLRKGSSVRFDLGDSQDDEEEIGAQAPPPVIMDAKVHPVQTNQKQLQQKLVHLGSLSEPQEVDEEAQPQLLRNLDSEVHPVLLPQLVGDNNTDSLNRMQQPRQQSPTPEEQDDAVKSALSRPSSSPTESPLPSLIKNEQKQDAPLSFTTSANIAIGLPLPTTNIAVVRNNMSCEGPTTNDE